MGIMIQTAILVIAILVIRKLFGEKLHAYIRYSLWLLVALRLLIPVNFIHSPFSLLRVTDMAAERYRDAAYASALPGGRLEEDGYDRVVQDNLTDNVADSVPAEGQAAGSIGNMLSENRPVDSAESMLAKDQPADDIGNTAAADPKADGTDSAADHNETEGRYADTLAVVLRMIWITGSLFVGGFLLTVQYRFRSRLCRMRKPAWNDSPQIKDLCNVRRFVHKNSLDAGKEDALPVYRVEGLESPCLVGMIHPAIYIGFDIEPESDYFRYIVTHEKVHYLHCDHIWALLRVVLASVYWFHPFVWIAAAASARDGEIACDHGTIRQLGEQERMNYGTMLLDLSRGNGRKRIYSYGTMLRPGRSEIKERILRLAGGSGNRISAGVLAVLLMFAVAGCAFTGASQGSSADGRGNAAAMDAVPLENNEGMTASGDAGSDDTAGSSIDELDDTDGNGITGDSSQGETLSREDRTLGSEDSFGTENSAIGEPFDPEENISVQRQITAVPAVLSEETPFGADGPSLDYAGRLRTGKENIIIFHDYFGLVVYDLTNGEVLRSLDLARIGCHMTQGDNVCQTRVSADGTTVWLHPQTRHYMFRYEVEENLLWQVPLVKTFETDLEAEDLFDRYLVTEEVNTGWHSNYLYEEYKDEQGLQTSYIYFSVSNGDELRLGNLQCIWDDMVYVLCDEDGAWPGQAKADFPYDYDGAVADVEILYDEPCAYSRISDSFGSRVHPVTGDVIAHEGIDYAAEEGTDVTAAADGVVYETGNSDEHGNYIVLLHVNGDMTYYCSCQKITVADGAQVKRGEKIATVGNTGRSTGAHLHFALSQNGWFVDPAEHMEGYVIQLQPLRQGN